VRSPGLADNDPKGDSSPQLTPFVPDRSISAMNCHSGAGRPMASSDPRLTLQLSGGVTACPARSKRIMKWRACCAHVTTYDRPLQLLVSRHPHCRTIHTFENSPR
jgi:hypothetical protein